nr:hypothetical protein [uncultured bacterium]
MAASTLSASNAEGESSQDGFRGQINYLAIGIGAEWVLPFQLHPLQRTSQPLF